MYPQTQDHAATSRIDSLDGLRGLASLWVLLGHAALLTGWAVPILREPNFGVDLFMMLSGFLMTFHFQLRAKKVSPDAPGEWRAFWIRRFFRIAPLYYVCLAAVLLLGPMLFDARMVIDSYNGVTPQLASRYLDSSPANVVLHGSFLFGLLPDYAFRTPLPDWSLSLEMQFYAAFPLLMLLLRRTSWLWGIAFVLGLSGAVVAGLHVAGIAFPMPAFLPLKLNMFICGMLIAAALADRPRSLLYAALALAIVLLPLDGVYARRDIFIREVLAVGFVILLLYSRLPLFLQALPRRIATLLGNRFFHWLGELSFGAYLIHLIVMQPIVALVVEQLGDAPAAVRFAVATALVVPPTYAIAYLTYRLVELPGQRLGAGFVRRLLGSKEKARSDAAESIAAP